MQILAEIPEVNRSVLIISLKRPYIDWANTNFNSDKSVSDQPLSIDEMNTEPSCFLIPEIFEAEDFNIFLKKNWKRLFEFMLSEWTSDESCWPKGRNLKSFNEWFDLKHSSLVFDLCESEPLEIYED